MSTPDQPTDSRTGEATAPSPFLESVGRGHLRQSLLQTYEPSIPFSEPVRRAAVAAVLRAGERGTELLFIQRATRQGDPWSGQMAFPGGKTEPADDTPETTAVRETQEELGLTLTSGDAVGLVSELDGGRATSRLVLVSAHGYWLDGPRPHLQPNYEVADTVWMPLAELADPERHIDYYYPPAETTFPGIQFDQSQQVLWGLTLRFVSDLFESLGQPFELSSSQ